MDHTRENCSFLAEPERRLLTAIARRMPAAINSDHLTLLGLVSMPIAGAAFALIPRTPWAAATFVAALAANWFGDSLDGTLARVRNRQRPRYGYYIDHVVDLVGTASLVAGIAASVALTSVVHVSWLSATAAAAELSIIHNFFWHERWTWKDRREFRGFSVLAKFARFNVATGIVGVGGNLPSWRST